MAPQGPPKMTHKIVKMEPGDDFFRKQRICYLTTPVQSKHWLLHACVAHFVQICHLLESLNTHKKTAVEITPKSEPLATQWLPKGSQMASFFGPFSYLFGLTLQMWFQSAQFKPQGPPTHLKTLKIDPRTTKKQEKTYPQFIPKPQNA